jgi:hypothetical protein
MTGDFTQFCKDLEAYETDTWAIEAILDVELMTESVMDPCCGTGRMAAAAEARGHRVATLDIHDWSQDFPEARSPDNLIDFLAVKPPGLEGDHTFFLNPPFSKACEFVDKCKELGARKIIVFQSWSWRSSDRRNAWWLKNPPARIWICIDRATCFRFDVPGTCPVPAECKGKKKAGKCRQCMGSTPTTHAFYVWERGHTGASVICDLRKPKRGKTP